MPELETTAAVDPASFYDVGAEVCGGEATMSSAWSEPTAAPESSAWSAEDFYLEDGCVGNGVSMPVEVAPIGPEAPQCTIGDATGLGLEEPGGYSVGDAFAGECGEAYSSPSSPRGWQPPARLEPEGRAISAESGRGMTEREFRRTADMATYCATFPAECLAHVDRLGSNPVANLQQSALSLKDMATGTQTPAQRVIEAAQGSGGAWDAMIAPWRNPRYSGAPRTKPTAPPRDPPTPIKYRPR